MKGRLIAAMAALVMIGLTGCNQPTESESTATQVLLMQRVAQLEQQMVQQHEVNDAVKQAVNHVDSNLKQVAQLTVKQEQALKGVVTKLVAMEAKQVPAEEVAPPDDHGHDHEEKAPKKKRRLFGKD